MMSLLLFKPESSQLETQKNRVSMLHQETNHQADRLHVCKLHAVSCIDDIEEGVGHFRGMPGTLSQRMLPDSHIPMLYKGCTIELTEAAAYVKSMHTGTTRACYVVDWLGLQCTRTELASGLAK
jgi:hypothetical protein